MNEPRSRTRYYFILLLVMSGILGLVWLAGPEPRPALLAPAEEPEVTAETTAESPTAVPTGPIGDEEARQLMDDLASTQTRRVEAAVDRILAGNDTRFVAVLVELIRANQIGIIRPQRTIYRTAADTLAGQEFGDDWPAWVEWYGRTDLAPPPGFTGWKGQLLAEIDPRFGAFLQDKWPSRIRTEEIQWGGVVVDGIPALDNPDMLEADKATYLEPEDAVFGIQINGDARAYPLRIVDWHEMANDVVGGVPVSLAYCTLCGAAIAYDGRAPNGETYNFGSSGFLFRSNKLMYDRQTRTLWNQLTGEPVLGELAGSDIRLSLLPVVLTTWREWQNQHPDTLVVDIDTGFIRDYRAGAAYADYFSAPITMFPVPQRDNRLSTKDFVYALIVDGLPKAYPVVDLTAAGVVNDAIGDTPLVLVANRGNVVIDGYSLRAGPAIYRAGGEVRAFERGDHTFQPGDHPDEVIDETGAAWQLTEEALVGPDGATLSRINGHLAYWFGWYAFYPETLVFGAES